MQRTGGQTLLLFRNWTVATMGCWRIAAETAGTEAEECHAIAAAHKDAGWVGTRE